MDCDRVELGARRPAGLVSAGCDVCCSTGLGASAVVLHRGDLPVAHRDDETGSQVFVVRSVRMELEHSVIARADLDLDGAGDTRSLEPFELMVDDRTGLVRTSSMRRLSPPEPAPGKP